MVKNSYLELPVTLVTRLDLRYLWENVYPKERRGHTVSFFSSLCYHLIYGNFIDFPGVSQSLKVMFPHQEALTIFISHSSVLLAYPPTIHPILVPTKKQPPLPIFCSYLDTRVGAAARTTFPLGPLYCLSLQKQKFHDRIYSFSAFILHNKKHTLLPESWNLISVPSVIIIYS